MIEPLRLSLVVECPVEHAFAVFAEKTTMWWPPSHSFSRDPELSVTFEPRVGGRIFERTPANTEHNWGEILVWEPPSRLGYLWHLRADRSQATEVQIRFIAQPDGTTRLEMVHSGWNRLGATGQARRDGNEKGWGGVLPHYVAACTRLPRQPLP